MTKAKLFRVPSGIHGRNLLDICTCFHHKTNQSNYEDFKFIKFIGSGGLQADKEVYFLVEPVEIHTKFNISCVNEMSPLKLVLLWLYVEYGHIFFIGWTFIQKKIRYTLERPLWGSWNKKLAFICLMARCCLRQIAYILILWNWWPKSSHLEEYRRNLFLI